ncbi:MAG: sugar ABC transporter substrate-binding protein [Negativicutes bacterium]|nr:sugar ABC transporter substrate-binding protein [Negativicutes bacterium]
MGKNVKVTVVLAAAIALTALAAAGCGPSDKPAGDGKIKIGMVVKALNSDYWKMVESGARAAGKDLGVEVAVLGPNAETDVTGQVSMIEDQITRKVSALVVAPSQPSSIGPVLEKAKQAGIPVVLCDTDAKWDDKVSFVGTGNRQGGKLAGEYLAGQLPEKAKVLILRGALGDATHDERAEGCIEALAAGDLEVAAVQPANSERAMAVSVTENILQSRQPFDAVFATNDEMALGALKALDAAGKDVIVVGFDGSLDALNSIEAGDLDATVAQSAYNIGYKGVEAAVKAARGEKVDKRIDTGTEIIDKDNVQEKLAQMAEQMRSK